MIGYSEYRADLPGGMLPYMSSRRASVVNADGTGRRRLVEELAREPNTWTSFAGWSPDGRLAVIGCGWGDPANAAWEEEHGTFRMTEGWLLDAGLLDVATGRLTNVTAVERVSDYNAVFFWPGNAGRLGMTALIDGVSTPFSMALDGTDKRELTSGERAFTYGLSVSPDGARIAYHKSYQIYVAAADGSEAVHVQTGNPFNFCPTWSPDGEWLLFVSGEHYDCHPHLARADGADVKKLADRQGYSGVREMIDTPAFHSASSDVPVWSPDGLRVYYTAKFGESVELMRVSLSGEIQRLTRSAPGVLHHHPTVSPDGRWVLYGANHEGRRLLYVARADGTDGRPAAPTPPGYSAAHGHWAPH